MASIFAKFGLPLLGKIVGDALGVIDNPAAKTASKALGDVGQAIEQGEITQAQIAIATLQADHQTLAEVNASMRAEIASGDRYVRRMRPTFGYIMAISWAAQMLGVAYVMVFDPSRAGELIASLSSLSAIWGVGLSVLGVYVYKRSEEKGLTT